MVNLLFNLTNTELVEGEFKINYRYFPSAPAQFSAVGGSVSTGGAEGFVELSKALNIVGDYRLSSSLNTTRWAMQNAGGTLLDQDYVYSIKSIGSNGVPLIIATERDAGNTFSGSLASQCFVMAINLETSNGLEISGLNAEEQSDISLLAYWKKPQQSGDSNLDVNLEVYAFYDAMIVLRPNNVIELIQ